MRCCARLPLYPSTPPRVKRTHAANQMKRVQRVEDSLAQSGARPQCGFHILPQRTPRGKRHKANMLARKRIHGGIGTEHIASRPVWRYAANSRRDRTQDIPREPCDRHDRARNAHVRRAARRPLPRAPTPRPELKPAGTKAAPAHNSRSHESENRFFASARNNAQVKIPHPHLRERRLKQNRARTK